MGRRSLRPRGGLHRRPLRTRRPRAWPGCIRSQCTVIREAFPDLAVEITDVVAQGARVAVWMRLSGTHHGEFRGYPGSGRFVTWDEVGFFTVDGGKIVAGRYLADVFGLRKALGVIPVTMR